MYFANGTKIRNAEGKVVAVANSSKMALEIVDALNSTPTIFDFNVDDGRDDEEYTYERLSKRPLRGWKQ